MSRRALNMDIRIETTEKECAILGNYFQNVVTDMKVENKINYYKTLFNYSVLLGAF